MPVQNKSHVPIGTVLEGKFRVTREIGRGGMAAVYEAENIDIGKRVAVKILAAELITSRVVRERFIREARAASAVRSPHICDVYDSGMYEERPFLVMELLEGESLYDMLTRLRRLDIVTTVTVITQTARGLAKAHESNVVHRDLKPENIFVTRTEEQGLVAKLLDFGLAKFYEPVNDGDPQTVRLTREGALFGTPAYMSPEQAKGQGEVDHRSDLWALGCIAYECLTGQTVWSVDQGVAMILAQVAGAPLPRPSRLRPDLPPEFEAWFLKTLDRDPDKRYQNARDLADSLEAAFGIGVDQEVSQRWRKKEPSVHTELEAVRLDELLASSPESNAASPTAEVEAATDVMTPEPVVSESPRSSGIGPLLIAAVLALGSYAAWFYWLHPPGEEAGVVTKAGAKGAKPQASATTKKRTTVSVDPETEPYALLLGEAQAQFRKEPKKAIEKFKTAFAMGSAAPARALLAHATVAVEEATPKGCRVTAIARPRPYSIEQAVSAPGLIHTAEGPLLTWVDNHADPRRRQGYAVLLDDALRRRGPPLAVTPEATNVDDFDSHAAGNHVALVYADAAGKESGVYSRLLETDGQIASSSRRLSSAKPAEFEVSLAASDGGYWLVWTEQLEFGSTDLVARRLSATLEPSGEPVRLSAFTLVKGITQRATKPQAVVSHGELQIVFSLQLPNQRQQVMLLSVPLSQLTKGLPTPKPGKRLPPPKNDMTLGTLRNVSLVVGRSPEPSIACIQEGCLVAWDEEKQGASVAFLEHGRAQPLWHREFAQKGSRPVLFGDEAGGAAAWFEESRLKFATIGRDGLGNPSLLNRVSGFQPRPALTRGSKPGEWVVAWRDYEAGHLELFALRAECP
jgi:eukaryotic-like serine/threonine-protein kinase